MNYKKISFPVTVFILTKTIIIQIIGLMIQRTVRDTDEVSNDYDKGFWKNKLDEKRWLQCKTPEEYVLVDDTKYITAKIDNQLVRIKTHDYYQYRLNSLQNIIATYATNTDEVWELGCGWGHNIFSLAAANHWSKLAGLDVSPNALSAAEQAAKHFKLNNVSFGTIDLTTTDDPGFRKIRDKTVFTYYCLEQLKYHTSKVIDNIRLAGVKRVIHCEATPELLKFSSLKDVANYLYIKRKDYLNNLLDTLWALQDKGLIKIIEQKRMYYSPTPRHDFTLIVWEPVN